MKKYPFVKQKELKDCGVTCLSMIIKYYKGYVPIERLRQMSKTSKNGVTAYHLVNTANNLGMKSYGVKIDSLDNLNLLPCVAHVTIDNSYNHYVVIYEIIKDKKEIIIADPASRIKKMTYEQFNKIFNNIIIILYPIKKLPLCKKEKSFSNLIMIFLKKYKSYFIKILLLSFIITILSIITSFYMEIMINHLGNICLLSKIFILFFVIYLLKNILDYLRNKTLLIVSNKIEFFLTDGNFSKIISLPYKYFKNRTTGEVITRFNDLSLVNEVIIKIIMIIMIDLPLSVLTGIFLLKINYILFIVSLLILLIYIVIVLVFHNKLKMMIEIVKEKRSNLNSYMVESIGAFETIKGLSLENNIINKYQKQNKHFLKNNYNFEKKYCTENLLKNIVNEIGILILIFIGFILVIKGHVTLGNLISFNALFIYFLTPIKNIIDLSKDIKEAKISYERINELIIEEKENNINRKLKFNNIKIKNLTYSYNDINENLKNINLELNKKDKIMFIGSSGSGKSTILKLLKKYYQINDKMIFIDNIDINKIEKQEIDDNITYVSQNEILFTDTLYNNLVLDRNIDSNTIDCVIKDTNIDFIDEHLGLNMLIEENGFNLSGGERERIILARSLLNNFKILILDEALNMVDVDLERKILKNILNKYADKMIIVVSHRYNNIDLFNKIIKLENGKIKQIKKNNS